MLGADGPLREMTPRSALEDRQVEKQQVTDTENTAYGAWAGDVGRALQQRRWGRRSPEVWGAGSAAHTGRRVRSFF